METYTILNGDSSMINGTYIKYFEDGNISKKGEFINGKAEGVFEEFYPNGTLLSKMTFTNGQRTGAFEVFGRGGKLTQKGRYENGVLSDTVETYFETGELKNDLYFKMAILMAKYQLLPKWSKARTRHIYRWNPQRRGFYLL